MKVREVMRASPRLCTPEDSLETAGRIMAEVNCGILPVVSGESARVIGMVTDRDICMALAQRKSPASAIKVKQAMNRCVYGCGAGDPLPQALEKMRRHKVRRLVVTDPAGGLEGVLALDDIVLHEATDPCDAAIALTLKAISPVEDKGPPAAGSDPPPYGYATDATDRADAATAAGT